MSRDDIVPIPDFDPSIGLLLACLADSTYEWRGELGEPSSDAIVWQPHPGGPSIGSQLMHLIAVESFWFEVVAAGKPRLPEQDELLRIDETDVDEGEWANAYSKPIGWYLDLHDKVRARSWQALKGLDAEKVVELRGRERTIRWIVGHVVQHDSYHGGQAVLLHEQFKRDHGE